MLLRRSLLTLIIEALILVLFSKLEFMIIIQYFAYFLSASIFTVCFSLTAVKEPIIKIERTLHRIDKKLKT